MTRSVSIAVCQFVMRPVKSFDGFARQVSRLLDRAEGADLLDVACGVGDVFRACAIVTQLAINDGEKLFEVEYSD